MEHEKPNINDHSMDFLECVSPPLDMFDALPTRRGGVFKGGEMKRAVRVINV